MTCTIYKQCAKDLICQKIKNTTLDNINLKHSSHETTIHSLNAIIGSEKCKAVEENLKWRSDVEVMWSTLDNDRETSFVGFAQVYSDRSQSCLSS